jgi:hypothetical protein
MATFRDAFDSLGFGQSMLQRLSDDGPVDNCFFAGGSGAKVRYFDDWLSAPKTQLWRVAIRQVDPHFHAPARAERRQIKRKTGLIELP